MIYKTYAEAREIALKTNKDCWIFEVKKTSWMFANIGFAIISDAAFNLCCAFGIPRGHVIVSTECIDMFTGVEQ